MFRLSSIGASSPGHLLDALAAGRPLAAAMLCLMLAGCFASTQPIFPLASAVPALGEGGRYDYYERDAKGEFQRQQTYQVIRHRNDAGYGVINQSADLTPFTLHAVGNGMLVAQSKSEGNSPPYIYQLLQPTDEGALVYIPDCKRQDKARMAAAGVALRGANKCVIDRAADPVALFASLDLGEPSGKLVRVAP